MLKVYCSFHFNTWTVMKPNLNKFYLQSELCQRKTKSVWGLRCYTLLKLNNQRHKVQRQEENGHNITGLILKMTPLYCKRQVMESEEETQRAKKHVRRTFVEAAGWLLGPDTWHRHSPIRILRIFHEQETIMKNIQTKAVRLPHWLRTKN